MTERPILFSGPMVRAILAGTKTQTRRVVKLPPAPAHLGEWEAITIGGYLDKACTRKAPDHAAIWHTRTGKCIGNPYGLVGDRLWVRETTVITPKRWNDGHGCTHVDDDGDRRIVQYLATHPDREAADDYNLKATPSIFMPRWACRLLLDVTAVRVERLQDISHEDAELEGVKCDMSARTFRDHYRVLWDSLNAKRGFGWSVNPWVWVVEFKKCALPEGEKHP